MILEITFLKSSSTKRLSESARSRRATALFVMGTEKAKSFAKKHNMAVMLIYKTDDGFEEYMSEAFKPLLAEQ